MLKTDNNEFDRMVEAEMKSASSLQNLRVNPNTQNYDITYHELRFTVNPNNTTPYINGIVKLLLQLLSDMNTVTFDMATALVVSSVTMNSSNLTFNQSNYELNINLPSTLTTGTSAIVENYVRRFSAQAEGGFTRSTHSGTPVIYTLSEPFGARDWWPCKQDLTDKIDSFDIYITCPDTYIGVSNGLLQSSTTSEEIQLVILNITFQFQRI